MTCCTLPNRRRSGGSQREELRPGFHQLVDIGGGCQQVAQVELALRMPLAWPPIPAGHQAEKAQRR